MKIFQLVLVVASPILHTEARSYGIQVPKYKFFNGAHGTCNTTPQSLKLNFFLGCLEIIAEETCHLTWEKFEDAFAWKDPATVEPRLCTCTAWHEKPHTFTQSAYTALLAIDYKHICLLLLKRA